MIPFFFGRYFTHNDLLILKLKKNIMKQYVVNQLFLVTASLFYSQAIELYAVSNIRVKVFRFVVDI